MAKQTIPGMKSSGGALPKFVFALALVAFLALVIKSPVAAADLVTTAMAGAGHVGESLMTFFGEVS
ncbi:hypothetical protein OOZ19_19865 [Saccharopolyspora sp. NFXS83]|uniref:hypothetical protein n=1 Tax=Saccharopolyspora sp. NFXS83 TaxID=2993560 RepID=UPI00224AA8C2|nr:hypothetical protein [Saccharopolyspora sp. NFXS83]MCX2732502.1 hypothetical protein [Saccharopolyspora sp. NFXS83]